MFLRFIHVVACVSSFLPFIAKSYSVVWMHHILFSHLPVNGCLGYFQFLAVSNNAAMNICMQVFVWFCVFISRGDTWEWILESSGKFMFHFLRNLQTVFQRSVQDYFYHGPNFLDGKMRHGEIQKLVQGHKACKWCRWELNLYSLERPL